MKDAGSTVAVGDSRVWGQHVTAKRQASSLSSTVPLSRLTGMGQLSLGPRGAGEWGHRSPPVRCGCSISRACALWPDTTQLLVSSSTVARAHTPHLPQVNFLHA